MISFSLISGLSIPLPVRTDKSKSKGKGIYRTSGSDDGSETGSVLSIGLGVPAEQWERERGVAPSTNRPFNPSTLQAIKSLPVRSPPPLDTASQFGSSSMMSGSGSGLSTWSEEEEEGNGDMRNDSRGNNRESPDRASDETFRRRHPPPHYSTIHSPSSADPRFYSGATKRGRTRPLPLRPESPVSPPFSSYPSSPSLSPPSANSRGWPTPPRPAYAHSISSGSSSSMPPTPPMHPLDLYTQRGRSKSPGAAQGLGLTMHSPTMIPWDAPGLGNRSEGSIHTPTGGIEIPRNNNNGDDPGVITGVVSGVDAAGRPYQYTYQYQSASGAPPNPGEMIAALGPVSPYISIGDRTHIFLSRSLTTLSKVNGRPRLPPPCDTVICTLTLTCKRKRVAIHICIRTTHNLVHRTHRHPQLILHHPISSHPRRLRRPNRLRGPRSAAPIANPNSAQRSGSSFQGSGPLALTTSISISSVPSMKCTSLEVGMIRAMEVATTEMTRILILL